MAETRHEAMGEHEALLDAAKRYLRQLRREGVTHTMRARRMTLAELRAYLETCHRCAALAEERTSLVFGVGNERAEILFVGEAPGVEEDARGEPFVGRAGRLLTKVIEAMGMRREEVYIANVLKCRPPGNRDPLAEEIALCFPFLEAQIEIIRPKVIVALGRIAAQSLLGTTMPMSKLRGRFFDYRGIPVMVTYHTAYLLRAPAAKGDVWEDMKQVLAAIGRKPPPRKAS